MIYAEAAYFEGNHCQHCAAREEHRRLERIKRQNLELIRRKKIKELFYERIYR